MILSRYYFPALQKRQIGYKGVKKLGQHPNNSSETLRFESKQSHSRAASPDHQTTHYKAAPQSGEGKSGREIMSGLTIS